MKKNISLILFAALFVSACSPNNSQTPTQPPSGSGSVLDETLEDSSDSVDLSDLDAIGNIDVEKELFDVTITVPADYIGEKTQEELDAAASEIGYKVKLNDDGSATFTMTKSQHKKMLKELTSELNDSLDELVGSEEYPTFTDIKANDNFTSFTITTTSDELNLSESFSVLVFYMYGGMYNTFSGESIDNVHIDFVNAESGEIISSSDSKDMASTEAATE